MRSLEDEGITVSGRRVLIIGAGGSAKAIGYHLAKEAGGLFIFNRNAERAEMLAGHLSGRNKVETVSSLESIRDYDIVINSTPLGLRPDDPPPFDSDMLRPEQVVCDLIYSETALIAKARTRGCRTVSGLGMLLWQGVLAFRLWTGIEPPAEIMRTALLSAKKQ
jgi:shikimate dehydrogenase